MNWLIDVAAVMVIPFTLVSFWRICRGDEFQALRESGQNLNLKMSNLHAGYMRPVGDPLRPSHIKLARIGLLHWALMLVGFLAVFSAGVLMNLLG